MMIRYSPIENEVYQLTASWRHSVEQFSVEFNLLFTDIVQVLNLFVKIRSIIQRQVDSIQWNNFQLNLARYSPI